MANDSYFRLVERPEFLSCVLGPYLHVDDRHDEATYIPVPESWTSRFAKR